MRHFDIDFYCIFDFYMIFLNGFCKSFLVPSWYSFLFSELKFLELYVRTSPAMFFKSSSPLIILATIEFFYFGDFYCFAVKICVRYVIYSAFRAIGLISL